MNRKSFGIVLAVFIIGAAGFMTWGGGGKQTVASRSGRSDPDRSEGISVHGHWTITVRDPDGTLVARHEFENDLHSLGDELIGSILSGSETQGIWEVALFAPASETEPCEPNVCISLEASSGATGNYLFKNLVVTPTSTGFTLEGFVTPTHDANIDRVWTASGTCAATTAPSACNQRTGGSYLTSKTLSPVVPVEAGQQVNVEVDISFS